MSKVFPYEVNPRGGPVNVIIVARFASYVGGQLLFTGDEGPHPIKPVSDEFSETVWEIPASLESTVDGLYGSIDLKMYAGALELSLWAGARSGSGGTDVHVDLIVTQDKNELHPLRVRTNRIPTMPGNRISVLEEIILYFRHDGG